MQQPGKKKLMTDINITPFTDVVLVLLIIFMVATPLIYQGKVKVQLPDSKAVRTEEKPQKMAITIDPDGAVYIDDRKYDPTSDADALRARMSVAAKANADTPIVINADRNCRYSSVMNVIDLAKDEGLKKIVLATQVKR
jgi:biopolymer transport protein ExbD